MRLLRRPGPGQLALTPGVRRQVPRRRGWVPGIPVHDHPGPEPEPVETSDEYRWRPGLREQPVKLLSRRRG